MGRRILFVRPQYANFFAKTGPVVTEPLELECLAAIATQMGFTYHIHDPFVDKGDIREKIQRLNPEIIAFTGYYPARPELFRLMRAVKNDHPEMMLIAGGTDIEVCYADYYASCADILVYSGGFRTFRHVLRNFGNGDLGSIDGICYRDENGGFVQTRPASMDPSDIPLPDRTHFYQYRSFYYYIGYGEVALVKGAYGCPYPCRFCYARLLNQGGYLVREMDDILDEIETIDAKTIWLVDDIFLPDENRAREFIDKVAKRGLQRDFIIYSRADFISEHEHLVPGLKQAGVVNVIVGLEAVTDRELDGYHKGCQANVNKRCARILARNDITLTALFIAGVDADFRYFFDLIRWILANRIKTYTVSVFTPLPGTVDFARHKSRLITNDPSKWDFMHLVLKPKKTGYIRYYIYLWSLYLLQALMHPRQLISFAKHWAAGKRAIGFGYNVFK